MSTFNAPQSRRQFLRKLAAVPLVAVTSQIIPLDDLTPVLFAAGNGPQKFPNSKVADVAEKYVGQSRPTGYGNPGECIMWMRSWVLEAGGTTGSGGPERTYTMANAVQVPLDEAQRGDVFQRSAGGNQWGTNPHTGVFRSSRYPDGTFDIVEGNFDGKGTVRTSRYRPVAKGTSTVIQVWRFGQSAVTYSPSGWKAYPSVASEVAITAVGSAGWELFHIGSAGRLYRMAPWSGVNTWTEMPGTTAKKVAAMRNPDGRVELVHVGVNDCVYHAWQSTPGGGFGPWKAYPSVASEVAITAVGSAGWELFHIGSAGRLYRMAPWSGVNTWTEMPGTTAKKVAAMRNPDGRVELVHVGVNDCVYHAWQSTPGGGFGPWKAYPSVASEVAITAVGSAGWELFHIGSAGRLYRMAPWSGVNTWTEMPGTTAKKVAVMRNPDGRVELVHVGVNDCVYHAWQSTPGSAYRGA